ncbi:MAG TPA: 3-hydroxybutyrate dehydrogenase [Stellaceae bacterium]|nr:3-hydroxybutyrate dehydrogenase [Stellaceae bacterium]
MSLRGKTALVTGSTSGIGLGIAHALAAEGCAIMLNGFGDASEIDTIRRDMANRHEVKVAHHAADVSKPEQIRQMIVDTASQLGPVDILVNNAGIQHVAPIEQFAEDKWDAIIAINLSAAFHATKAVLPTMRNRGWGRIVNIASAHGLVASEDKAGYVAAKHGLVGLTKVTALEAASSGITCNAICPGWVLTPLVEKQIAARAGDFKLAIEQAKADLLREKQKLLAFTTPEQIGAMIVFLSGENGATMTGAALSMDGGWVAQ